MSGKSCMCDLPLSFPFWAVIRCYSCFPRVAAVVVNYSKRKHLSSPVTRGGNAATFSQNYARVDLRRFGVYFCWENRHTCSDEFGEKNMFFSPALRVHWYNFGPRYKQTIILELMFPSLLRSPKKCLYAQKSLRKRWEKLPLSLCQL